MFKNVDQKELEEINGGESIGGGGNKVVSLPGSSDVSLIFNPVELLILDQDDAIINENGIIISILPNGIRSCCVIRQRCCTEDSLTPDLF